MLKKIAIACAGFVLAGQTALFAQSANPLDVPSQPAAEQPVVPAPAKLQTYIGEIDGIPVVLQVRGANNAASGFLIVGSERCALTATINGPTLEGTWQAASGKSYAFRATISGQGVVTLETNGKSLTLRSPSAPMTQPSNLGDGPAPAPAPAPAPKPANDAGGDASLDKVGVKIGQYFTAPLPNGWQMMDGPIGAFIGSADRKSAFGVIGPSGAPSAVCACGLSSIDFSDRGYTPPPAEMHVGS